MTTNIVKFLKYAMMNGGGSYSIQTGRTNPKYGYMVSLFGHEKIFDKFPSNTEVAAYILENSKGLSLEGSYLGMWLNDGKWYLDVSINIKIIDRAMIVAAANKQLAFYDCENNQSISIS